MNVYLVGVICLLLGGMIGMVTTCILTAAKEADRHIEDCGRKVATDSSEQTERENEGPT